jgi:hypothetical protein
MHCDYRAVLISARKLARFAFVPPDVLGTRALVLGATAPNLESAIADTSPNPKVTQKAGHRCLH